MVFTLLKKIVEFLVGFFLIPILEGLIYAVLLFLIPSLVGPVEGTVGTALSITVIMIVVEIILFLICFRIRKIVAFGYLFSIISGFLFDFALPSLFGLPSPK